MIDAVTQLSDAAAQCAARLTRALGRAMISRGARRALRELPDDLLGDLGLTRNDLLVIAEVVSEGRNSSRNTCDQPSWKAAAGAAVMLAASASR